MKITTTTNATLAQALTVLITRKTGNQFYAGKTSDLDTLGSEIKNREGYYPLVGNIPEGKPVMVNVRTQDGEEFTLDVQGVSVTMPVSEQGLEQLNEQAFNGLHVAGAFVVSPRDGFEAGSVLNGSLWLEPVSEAELEVSVAPAGVASKEATLKAVEENRARNAARRSQMREAAKAGRDASLAEKPAEATDLINAG